MCKKCKKFEAELKAAYLLIGERVYEEENALLKNSHGRKATNKKRMKPKHRQRLGYLKLIAVNGVPISNKD